MSKLNRSVALTRSLSRYTKTTYSNFTELTSTNNGKLTIYYKHRFRKQAEELVEILEILNLLLISDLVLPMLKFEYYISEDLCSMNSSKLICVEMGPFFYRYNFIASLGIDCYGFYRSGFHWRNFIRNGMHFNGTYYDDDGYNFNYFNRNGIHRNGTRYDHDGYDCNGFYIDGYSQFGLAQNDTIDYLPTLFQQAEQL